jgi:hypothetical protein
MPITMTRDVLQEAGGKTLTTPEIRVWCHPVKGGDDFYYVFPTFRGAEGFIKKVSRKEFIPEDVPLIAYAGFEIDLYGLAKKMKRGG